MRSRRPSPALVVACIAVFVAVGGPAWAKGVLVGSKQIKDGSIAAKDLRAELIKNLQTTPNNGVTTGKIADGNVAQVDLATNAVSRGKIEDGAVSVEKLADRSVSGAKVADGSLKAKDIGGFAGKASIALAPQGTGCTGGTTDALKPLIKGVSLANDAIVATPGKGFPDGVTVTARPAGKRKFHVSVCGAGAPSGQTVFRYVTVDVAGG